MSDGAITRRTVLFFLIADNSSCFPMSLLLYACIFEYLLILYLLYCLLNKAPVETKKKHVSKPVAEFGNIQYFKQLWTLDRV